MVVISVMMVTGSIATVFPLSLTDVSRAPHLFATACAYCFVFIFALSTPMKSAATTAAGMLYRRLRGGGGDVGSPVRSGGKHGLPVMRSHLFCSRGCSDLFAM
jgi:hypothetical protein